jgi:ABC-type uncharacterized transport system permease subunit
MDSRVLIAIAMLVVWGFGTLRGWPGWVHGLLTGGVFLLIYGIVARKTRAPTRDDA